MSFYVHPTAVIDEGAEIADDVRVWHFCHLMPRCRIGAGSVLGQNVFVASGVVLGKNVHVQNNVSLYEGLQCEDNVFLGPSVVFTNIKNPRSAVPRKGQYQPTIIRQGASIGANATIVCGNEIGAFALVGAGAVVTRPVHPYALVKGTPAVQDGWVSEWGNRLDFDSQGMAVCPESGQQYQLRQNEVKRIS